MDRGERPFEREQIATSESRYLVSYASIGLESPRAGMFLLGLDRPVDTVGEVKLISWNVNGLRSVLRKNFLEFLAEENPDVLCLQETKAGPNDVEQLWPASYTTYWNTAEKKGYAGTAILTKTRPLQVTQGIGIAEHDREGRVLTAEYDTFFLVNAYVPNSKRELSRLAYRQLWDRDFLSYLKTLERTKPVVFCGDLNVAHTEIDLANPKANVRNHGFTPEERAGFEALVQAGFLDTFREFEKGGGHYSWWSPFANARARNIGWRIDYFLISPTLRPRLCSAFIRCAVLGSDHCPVGIELD
jgi:exodeoxyribonuclease III